MAMLVAGAAGFIDNHLTDRLLGAGRPVIGVDKLSRETEANLAQAARDPRRSCVLSLKWFLAVFDFHRLGHHNRPGRYGATAWR